jgi:high-affinity nickel-transport protein
VIARLRAALSPAEWRRVALLGAAVLGLHLAGFLILLVGIGGGAVIGAGIGITAYTLGMRHAFDADHIGAIDNTTRKLMHDGQRPLSVGFWFALGHSTVVLALGLLVMLGVRGVAGAVEQDDSALRQATGFVGPVVSGSFLFLIGILNLIVLAGVLRVFRGMRRGELDERELERRLDAGGVMTRFYGRATRAVRKPWHMYPLGVLFGLGFDTATEVSLLILAGGAAAGGLPFYAILCLPILFAAGMTLFDTIDGAFMNFAYGWSFSKPVRKLYYNIAITGLSVAVALLIGSLELLGVAADRLGLSGGVWDVVASVDLTFVGYAVAGLFVATWVLALGVWHFGRIEERWTARVDGVGPAA